MGSPGSIIFATCVRDSFDASEYRERISGALAAGQRDELMAIALPPTAKNFHKVENHLPLHRVGRRVLIDGKEMKGVRNVTVTAPHDGFPVVNLEFIAEVETHAEVTELPTATGAGAEDVAKFANGRFSE